MKDWKTERNIATKIAMIMHIHCIQWWRNMQWNAQLVW